MRKEVFVLCEYPWYGLCLPTRHLPNTENCTEKSFDLWFWAPEALEANISKSGLLASSTGQV
jgi:hypothetical protein